MNEVRIKLTGLHKFFYFYNGDPSCQDVALGRDGRWVTRLMGTHGRRTGTGLGGPVEGGADTPSVAGTGG